MTELETVPTEAISGAPPEVPATGNMTARKEPLTADPNIAPKKGVLGFIFGAGEEKRGNIAGLAFILFFILLCVVIYHAANTENEKAFNLLANLITPIFGALTGLIGSISGRNQLD